MTEKQKMSGKYIYMALGVLLGVLGALVNPFLFLFLFFLYVLVLAKIKMFKPVYIFILFLLSFVFFLKGEWAEADNQSKLSSSKTIFYIEYISDPMIDGDLLKVRSEEHTSELQSHVNLVCRL